MELVGQEAALGEEICLQRLLVPRPFLPRLWGGGEDGGSRGYIHGDATPGSRDLRKRKGGFESLESERGGWGASLLVLFPNKKYNLWGCNKNKL